MSQDQHARAALIAAQLEHVRAVNLACRTLTGKALADALRQADEMFHVKQETEQQ